MSDLQINGVPVASGRPSDLSLQDDSFMVQAISISNALGSPRIKNDHITKQQHQRMAFMKQQSKEFAEEQSADETSSLLISA